MRPQRLEIEGIHSFREKQTVDFASLASSGLFGIFGDTGSGKSTVLDCIILALYGEIPGESAAQFIHLKCNTAAVALEFALGGRRYRAERNFRFNGRRDKVTPSARLVDLDSSAVLCEQTSRVTDEIVELLGLSLAEFCKVVALPQGEFSSFLKSTSGDQVNIAGKLFSLERYGDPLIARANARAKFRRGELEAADARLAEFSEVSEEAAETAESAQRSSAEQIRILAAEETALSGRVAVTEAALAVSKQIARAEAALSGLYKQRTENAERFSLAARKKDCEESVWPAYESAESAKRELSACLAETAAAKRSLEESAVNVEKLTSARKFAEQELEIIREQYRERSDKFAAANSESADYAEQSLVLRRSIDEYNAERKIYKDNSEKRELARQAFEGAAKRLGAAEERRGSLGDELTRVVSREFLESVAAAFETDRNRAEQRYPGVGREFDRTSEVLSGAKADTGLLKSYAELSEQIQKLERERSVAEGEIGRLGELLNRSEREQIRISESGKAARGKTEAFAKKLAELGLSNPEELAPAKKRLEDGLKSRETSLAELRTREEKAILDRSGKTSALSASEAKQSALARRSEEAAKEFGRKSGAFPELAELVKIHSLELSAESLLSQSEALEKQISDTEVELRTLKSSRTEEVSEQTVREQTAKLSALRERLSNLREENAMGGANLSSLKTRLLEKQKLIERRKLLERRCDLSESVAKAVRGKELMKFAVEEYLREICASASGILGGITAGSYRLIYENRGDRECGFFVADNRNGGEKRAVVTLSGGETFLVSLSLAVALSEAVALGGANRVEFFFLDEGFGSLDARLCDVVLDALYKLKENRFVIGLISHVEGLKERIESKLFVEFSEDTGSRIRV